MVLYMLYSYAKIQKNFKPPKKGWNNRDITTLKPKNGESTI